MSSAQRDRCRPETTARRQFLKRRQANKRGWPKGNSQGPTRDKTGNWSTSSPFVSHCPPPHARGLLGVSSGLVVLQHEARFAPRGVVLVNHTLAGCAVQCRDSLGQRDLGFIPLLGHNQAARALHRGARVPAHDSVLLAPLFCAAHAFQCRTMICHLSPPGLRPSLARPHDFMVTTSSGFVFADRPRAVERTAATASGQRC